MGIFVPLKPDGYLKGIGQRHTQIGHFGKNTPDERLFIVTIVGTHPNGNFRISDWEIWFSEKIHDIHPEGLKKLQTNIISTE